MSHLTWPLIVQFLTSDVGLALIATLIGAFVIAPLWRNNWRAREIIKQAADVFDEVERIASQSQDPTFKGQAKLWKFLKLLRQRVGALTAEEAALAAKYAQAWAANGSAAPPGEGKP